MWFVISLSSNTGGLFVCYFQHQEWGGVSEFAEWPPLSQLLVVERNTICTSVSIWIMGKHVITSPRRLGIHPALVFKLIPQMPSAWHFCEEAGTPSSSHCWNSSHGAEQAQSWFFFFLSPLAHTRFFLYCTCIRAPLPSLPIPSLSSASPPQGVLPPVYWETRGLRWLITAQTHQFTS